MKHEEVESLVAVFRSNPRLTELEVRSGGRSLRLKRAARSVATGDIGGTPAVAGQSDASGGLATIPPDTSELFVAAEDDQRSDRSRSTSVFWEPTPNVGSMPVAAQLVGVFRARRPAGLVVGDRIEEDQSLGQIEAMRLLNDCPSPMSGHISAVYVQDGEPVEFGQLLFDVAAPLDPKS